MTARPDVDALAQTVRSGLHYGWRIGSAEESLDALVGRVRELEAALEQLRDVVDDIAWNGYAWIGSSPCVKCGGEQPKHDNGCTLLVAATRARAALAPSAPRETA